MKLIGTLSASGLLVATLTSCVAPAKESKESDASGKKIEYVYITPTGSNVPIKVPKNQQDSTDDSTAASSKALQDLQRNGAANVPQSPSGK